MTLYASVLPLDCLVRVWDNFFVFGIKYLLEVGLAIVSYNKDDWIQMDICEIAE